MNNSGVLTAKQIKLKFSLVQLIKDENEDIVDNLSQIEVLEKQVEQAQKISTMLGQDSYRTSSRQGRVPSQYAYGTLPQKEASTNSFKTPSWINAMSLQPGQKTMLKQSFRDYTSKESKPSRWIV